MTNGYEKNLLPPERVVDAVLDTDAYNEIDDQFAIAYMIGSGDRINIKALYAAPFFNDLSTSAEDGMEKSYNEIHKLLLLMKKDDMRKNVYRGSRSYLPDEKTPVISDAAEHLSKLATSYTSENPLYVIAIGAITNVASALLINPQIADRIVIVWLGGHSFDWPNTKEFNMYQDVAAARVVFDSEAPVIMLPCMGVVSEFKLSGDDLRARFYGKNDISTYLAENTENAIRKYVPIGKAWSRVIWDVTAVAWLTSRENGVDRFMNYRTVPAPICEYDYTYSHDNNRKKITYVYFIRRDALVNDLIDKLTK